ncbi:MAG: YpdA family putative bacillithiol disulfide reductase [Bacteroidetes bacterium]|nr:YpdA family putative bacillithiol disulfide reductase [Bacteroidota bacterium]
MSENFFDIIIIGAGPIGLSCGIEAVKRKYSHLIIEKGCLVNSIFHYPANMTFFSTSERLEIGDVPFVSHGDKPTRREALEYYRRVKHAWNLNVKTYEKVVAIEEEKNKFAITSDKGKYFCKKLIISTGFFDKPNYLNIPGEELPKVKHYFDEAHPYAYLKLVVIGAANSAVDVALETYRRGSEVTMVIREDKIRDSVKYWVKPDIDNRIKEGSIKAYFNSNLLKIKEREVEIQTPDGIITIENDFVFAMTGYHPDHELLRKAGVNILGAEDKAPQFDHENFETNRKGIYLAGVVCSGIDTGKWFIENSRYHAVNIFNHIEKTLVV